MDEDEAIQWLTILNGTLKHNIEIECNSDGKPIISETYLKDIISSNETLIEYLVASKKLIEAVKDKRND